MIYVKYFIIYSILGFLFESFVFKFSNINKHIGILIGPYTLVYGIGGVICYYINEQINFNIVISYLIFTIICSLIELIIGHLIHFIYKKDSWNYSYKRYHFGKYICIEYSLIWGILAIIFVKKSSNILSIINTNISDKASLIIILIMVIDIIYSYLKEK